MNEVFSNILIFFFFFCKCYLQAKKPKFIQLHRDSTLTLHKVAEECQSILNLRHDTEKIGETTNSSTKIYKRKKMTALNTCLSFQRTLTESKLIIQK